MTELQLVLLRHALFDLRALLHSAKVDRGLFERVERIQAEVLGLLVEHLSPEEQRQLRKELDGINRHLSKR